MHKTLLSAALLAALTLAAAGTASARSPAVADGATPIATDGAPHRGHGRHGPPGDPVDALARLDTDGDGRISHAEAEAARQAGQARREARQAARQARDGEAARPSDPGARKPHGGPGGPHARGGRGIDLVADFAAIDRDGDGFLTRSELRRWHDAKRAERRAEGERRFDAMFREADLNGDGRLSRVEVDEKLPRLAARFAWLDENRDGTLSREELQAGRPQR
ncbi:EF-hand domain-containing protein [Luteimonas sp. FCS-9]|uniref:EF-hand domain-containing protein n=1 Tax=Luteimonas sp. FCS-9 TaxID=1547516 RepID=UPI00069C3F04|nr:EF-hand domain-containing protein [Luteimonas sp. FCS-9]